MRKKDQWTIHNISTGESRSFDIKTPKKSARLFMGQIKRSYRRPTFYFIFFRALKRFKKLFVSNKRTKHTIVEIPQLRWLFSNTIKGGLTVMISVLIIFGVVHAGTITPPSGGSEPSAKFFTLSEIYNLINSNATTTEASHSFAFSDALEGTGHTLTEIYNKLIEKIALLDPTKILTGETYFGTAGTMPNNGTFSLTASSTAQTIAAGYYDGGTLPAASSTDTDLIADNIRNNTDIFGVIGNMIAGYLYGSSEASQVLTSAGAGAGTYNANSLSTATVKKGTAFGVSQTGAYTGGYPGSAWTGGTTITQSACEAQSGWYWFEDGNGDGDPNDPEDGLCVKSSAVTSLSWNGSEQIAEKLKIGGQATGGSATTIVKTGAGWTTNAWVGYTVRITSGTGSVCERSISSNTADTITVANWCGTNANSSSFFVILQTATGGSSSTIVKDSAGWTTNEYADAVIKITAGTGSTQKCWGIVKSNTSDTITIYGSWLKGDSSAYAACTETPPDATSVFVVEGADGFASYDNSWIGDWTCTGSFSAGNGAPSWGSFPTSAQVGSGYIALASADCYDGVRDLLPNQTDRAVKTGTADEAATSSAPYYIKDNDLALNTNAWVGQKVLITGGSGSGGYGRIESNDNAGKITVDSWTGGDPDVGSTFAIIYLIPHATYNPGTNVDNDTDDQLNGNNGPLTQEVLNNWKGTRLPTASDFFGFCGYRNGGSDYESTTGTYTADKTYGNYGGQVGRTDEFLDLANSGSWEWLSEQHNYYSARIAGSHACSYFSTNNVYNGYRFRAVFRP